MRNDGTHHLWRLSDGEFFVCIFAERILAENPPPTEGRGAKSEPGFFDVKKYPNTYFTYPNFNTWKMGMKEENSKRKQPKNDLCWAHYIFSGLTSFIFPKKRRKRRVVALYTPTVFMGARVYAQRTRAFLMCG